MNPDIVLGPPGTGKTTALLDVARRAMSNGVRPEDIGFVSFTRRAAHEGASRVGVPAARLPHWRTIHSAAYRALGLTPGDVLEGRRMLEFGDWAGVELSRNSRERDRGVWVGHRPGDRMVHMENLARVRRVPLRDQYDAYDDDLPWNQVRSLANNLEYYKRQKYLVDYTDMLTRYAESAEPPHLHTLLVDEAQDLSLLQWSCVERMAERAENVVVAGDDDQTIYPWAGAAVDHFIHLPGRVRVLGQSWRVPGEAQAAALEVIGGVLERRPKRWAARPEPGLLERAVGLDAVDFDGEDVLVLARNHLFLEKYAEPLLRREGVFYEISGRLSVDPLLLRAILDWERLRRGERLTAKACRAVLEYTSHMEPARRELPGVDDDAELDMTELVARGLRDQSVWHAALDRLPPEELSYVLAMRTRGEKLNQRPRVRLSTIHGSKGAEADHVVLLTSQTPRVMRESMRDPWSEARVWYVALTRTRRRLTLVRDPTGRRERDL